jgi:hypothetical protein
MNRLIRSGGFALPLLLLGCSSGGDRYSMSSGNQGSFKVKREPNPMDSMPRAAPAAAPVAPAVPSGPTTREVELQQKIDDLEARQKAMADEIQRLKREKAAQQ